MHTKNMKKIPKILLAVILLACTNDKGIIETVNSESCLPDTEFNVSGITNQSTREFVMDLKGKPKSTKYDEDLRLETLIYADMTLEISNNYVLYLSTESRENSTPNGIRPGLSKSGVFEILGLKISDGKRKEYQILNCNTESYMVLRFNEEKLTYLGMGIDLP